MYEITIVSKYGLKFDHYGNKEYETYDDAYDACLKYAIEDVKRFNMEKYHNRYLARYYEGGCFEVILDHKIKIKGRNCTLDGAAVVYYKTRDINCRDENDLDPEIMQIYAVSPCDNSDISRKRYIKDKNKRMTAKDRRDKCIEDIIISLPIVLVFIFLLLCFLGKIFNWG